MSSWVAFQSTTFNVQQSQKDSPIRVLPRLLQPSVSTLSSYWSLHSSFTPPKHTNFFSPSTCNSLLSASLPLHFLHLDIFYLFFRLHMKCPLLQGSLLKQLMATFSCFCTLLYVHLFLSLIKYCVLEFITKYNFSYLRAGNIPFFPHSSAW